MKTILAPLLGLILIGCGSIPEADPEAVSSFKPHQLEGGDDIGVYLIRPNQIAGSGRDYWVATDDAVIGDLENSSYVFLSLNSKENSSINTVASMAGQNYIGLPETTGEKEYYFYSVDFTSWIPRKLSSDIGKTLVSNMEQHELDQRVRPNDGFDNLSMNPGMVDAYMERISSELVPDQKQGVVYFFRPSSTEKSMALSVSVWANDAHLGSIEAKQYFGVKLPAGKHTFYRRDGKFHALNMDVKANQYHYVELEQSFSFTGYNHNLIPKGSEEVIENKEVKSWLDTLVEYAPISKAQWSERQQSHVDRGLNYLKENKPLFDEGE